MGRISEQGFPHQVVTIPCIQRQENVEPKFGIQISYILDLKKKAIYFKTKTTEKLSVKYQTTRYHHRCTPVREGLINKWKKVLTLHIHQETRSYQQDQALQFLGAGINEQASCVSINF